MSKKLDLELRYAINGARTGLKVARTINKAKAITSAVVGTVVDTAKSTFLSGVYAFKSNVQKYKLKTTR